MLEHHQALDTFVGDELIRKANCSQDIEKHLQLPTSSGSQPINVAIVSSEHGEPPSEQRKMNFSQHFPIKVNRFLYVQQTTKGYHASSQKSWNYLSIYEYVLQRTTYHV